MPLFMDRHDLPGSTAEMLAQAHLTDLQTQAKYDVLVSEPLRDLGLEKGFAFDAGREVDLKGFPASTRVFELLPRSS